MEMGSIMKIKKDNTIIVKECDKGGVCIMIDAKFYKERCVIYYVTNTPTSNLKKYRK